MLYNVLSHTYTHDEVAQHVLNNAYAYTVC
jgi:hypothetical protein